MKVLTQLDKNFDLSLALGFFDGVHAGHRAVIKSAVNYAKQNNIKSAVITFKDHPCCFLRGICPKYILPNNMRESMIEQLGVDYLYELNFEDIANYTAEEYFQKVLLKFAPKAITTGWNHHFGHNKSGDVEFLQENSKKYGYEYFEIPPKKFGDEIVSSTSIRKYLSEGEIQKANEMLSYNFSLSENVIKGNQIGRTIGFKTANINYPAELVEIPYGVYAVNTNFGKAIANYGIRPTVCGSHAVLEIHILNFDKDIYGKNIEVEFLYMIRKEKKFSSLNELQEQIKIDISKI